MRWLDSLDDFGTDDPDFNEGHPEDRCPICESPVIDHPTWRHPAFTRCGQCWRAHCAANP